MDMFRQGDVLLIRAKSSDVRMADYTKVAREAGRVVLAHGEATGHAHAIVDDAATLYETGKPANDNARRLLVVERPVDLVHEEHEKIHVDPGVYYVVRQREYTDQDLWRNVAD
jgi:hypothetical protein